MLGTSRGIGQERETATTPSRFSLVRREGPWRDALLRRMLALADASAALAASISLGLQSGGEFRYLLWSALFVPVWLVLAKLNGLYDRDQRSLRHLTVDELPHILIWAILGTVALTLLLMLTPVGGLSAGAALRAWLVVSVAAFVFRAAARFAWRRLTPPERTMIIGRGPLVAVARRKLELFPDMHVTVVEEHADLSVEELRSDPDSLAEVDRVLVAAPVLDEELIAELVAYCRQRRIKLSIVPPAQGMFGTAVQLNHVADLPVLEYNTWDVSRSTLLLKRLIDMALAFVLLILLAPLFLLIALVVAFDSRGPILFTQMRAGQYGRPFRMLKFRTMVADAEEQLDGLVRLDELREPMFKLVADPRVTRVGRRLRRRSLDELPQLLNVLLGDMSLVGPRPEQIELVERYAPEHQFRLLVKPGLTGPMQVSGRGHLTFEERLAVEREYVESISIGRDLRILALTVAPLFSGRGAF